MWNTWLLALATTYCVTLENYRLCLSSLICKMGIEMALHWIGLS